jgi:microcompartment protein PduB
MEELFGKCSLPQFVGVGVCDSIGLVIPNIDDELKKQMNIPERFHAIGLIGSRTGAGAQIQAVDDAVKQTSSEVISIEIPRDTKGWGGHGNFIIIGSDTVADVRRAVETALKLIDINAGEIYISEAGHMEFQYSARAAEALNIAFDVPIGEVFGFVCASPAPIGMVISDIALKSAGVKLLKTLRPDSGTSHSNEVIIIFTGEASAVKKAVIDAREAGLALLRSLGSEPLPVTKPYIK